MMNSTLVPESSMRLAPDAATVSRPIRRDTDNYFFAAMSMLILGTVYLGFAHSYYLAGTVHARLPSAIIHVHAVVFSGWILLFIAQTTLVSIGRVNWHKRLGIVGAVLACLVVALGVMSTIDSTRRHFTPPGQTAGKFLAISLLEMVVFATLVTCGLLARRDRAAHKRLILLAYIALLGAPIGRWPFGFIRHFAPSIGLVIDAFLLSLVIFDLFTRRRIERATLCGSLLIFLMAPVAFGLLGPATIWQQFAAWVQR